jgi:4-hydroxy-4-methyl-2-oxoglutarate aldolase
VDLDLIQVVPGSRVAGPARTVLCGQGDNLMVHAVMAEVQPGEVLVLTMPEPRPVALVGELLATQALAQGAAAMLIDASVRDVEELAALGLPIWARWVRVRGADKAVPGAIGEPVTVGGAVIRQGDVVVLDADGVAVVESERVSAVLDAARERAARERVKRARCPTTSTACANEWKEHAYEQRTPRPRAYRPLRAADSVPRREPALLRGAVRDAGGAPRGAVGVPARVG